MKPVVRYLLIGVVAAAAGVAGYVTRQGMGPDLQAGVAADAGESLMALSLPDADGTPHSLDDWRGKVLVVNFWATWCAPCRKEIPDFAAVSRRYAEAPVQFVGISIDSAENVRAFAEELKIPYPLLIGSVQTLDLAKELGNSARALPFTVILDTRGKIAHIKLGTLNERDLEGKIRALLAS